MADNTVVFSILNPVKFRRKGYENPDPYNTKYFDEWNYADTIRDFEQQVGHLQPWQNNDIIELVLLSNYAPFSVQLIKCDGTVADTFAFASVASSTDDSGLFCYRLSIALDVYAEGVYKLEITAGSPVIDTFESEWFSIAALHSNSYLLQYSHDENDYDVPFEIGVEFRLRALGGFSQFKPGTDRKVFIDQPRNAVQLDAKPFNAWKLFFGDGAGVPDWFIERINLIFCCSKVLVDGRQFVAADGAQVEPNREADYPLAGWSLDVRPASSANSKKFTKAVDGGTPPNTTLVYNIDTRGFGPDTTGGASSNIIQVTAND